MVLPNGFQRPIPAAYTPFAPDGSLHLDQVAALADLYLEAGLDAVFVGGTTGEFASMAVDERILLAERWMDTAGDRLRVLVHVGHTCQRDALQLARHARAIGAAGISALAPSYFLPADADALAAFLAPIAAAAAPLPFYYYEIPSMTGVRIPPDAAFASLDAAIPTFAGLKYSSHDLVRFQRCRMLGGDTKDLLFGSDEMLLAAVAVGASGAIGSTYNYIAPLYTRMFEAWVAGDADRARQCQHASVAFVDVLNRFGGLPAGKALMALLGADCGPVRPPLTALDNRQVRALYDALAGNDAFVRPLQPPPVPYP